MPNLFQEFASIKNGRDITRGWVNAIGNYLPSQDSLLLLKSGGDLELYEQVAQDDQVKSCLQQRFRAVTAYPWQVTPGGEKRIDKAAAEHLEQQLKSICWDACNEKMLWSILYGYSAAEIIWERQDEKIGIADIRVRDRRRFLFNIDRQLALRTTANPLGEVVPDKKFWHFAIGATHDDEPYGRGLGHWLYWPTFFKRNGVRWWLRFLELFASPARKGNYPNGATQSEKDILWQAMNAFGQDDQIMIPEGMLIEFLETSRNGAVDYQSFVNQMDAAISKIILSQTMTTDSGSSEAQATVHENVALSIVESDAELLCESFNNTVARWLTDWNFPGAAYPKVSRILDGEEDLKALADRDKVLSDMGFAPNAEYIVTTYGEGFRPEEKEEEPPTLNSTQVNSFISLVGQATQGGWSKDVTSTALQIAFPSIPKPLLDKLAKSIEPEEPTEEPTVTGEQPTTEQEDIGLDDAAGMFAAPKKKTCSKGISCGNTCISSNKVCRKSLTPTQKEASNRIRKSVSNKKENHSALVDAFANKIRNGTAEATRNLASLVERSGIDEERVYEEVYRSAGFQKLLLGAYDRIVGQEAAPNLAALHTTRLIDGGEGAARALSIALVKAGIDKDVFLEGFAHSAEFDSVLAKVLSNHRQKS